MHNTTVLETSGPCTGSSALYPCCCLADLLTCRAKLLRSMKFLITLVEAVEAVWRPMQNG